MKKKEKIEFWVKWAEDGKSITIHGRFEDRQGAISAAVEKALEGPRRQTMGVSHVHYHIIPPVDDLKIIRPFDGSLEFRVHGTQDEMNALCNAVDAGHVEYAISKLPVFAHREMNARLRFRRSQMNVILQTPDRNGIVASLTDTIARAGASIKLADAETTGRGSKRMFHWECTLITGQDDEAERDVIAELSQFKIRERIQILNVSPPWRYTAEAG